ncbi:hypothetical protein [Micromonospora tulbaghiae]|uniref:hypothetical protein n=1 Tax=Micromonospora tulbaghiae TaxID=479978 RepID=UPI0033D3D7BB
MTAVGRPERAADDQAWQQVLESADHDPILAAVLADAEMQQRAEHADRMLLLAEQSGPVAQPTARRRPAWWRRLVIIAAVVVFLAVPVLLST